MKRKYLMDAITGTDVQRKQDGAKILANLKAFMKAQRDAEKDY